MRAAVVFFIVGLMNVSAIGAQKTPAPAPKSVELTGCVSGEPGSTGAFTFTDAQSGGQYKLTGKRMQKYAGQKVAVSGGPSKKLVVSGGLWPSPNAAGQAGALDPAQESIARQPGGATKGPVDGRLPEFNVVRVRTVDGVCRS